MTSTTVDRQQLLTEVETLEAQLAALPQHDPFDRALYHCERLAIALKSSHAEGTRFAAFSVAKIVHDQAAGLPPELVQRMQAIKSALEAMGLDLSK